MNDQLVADVLNRSAKRIMVPGQWTKNALARDAKSQIVHPRDPSATCWCAMGAIEVECGVDKDLLVDVDKYLFNWLSQERFTGIATVNDTAFRPSVPASAMQLAAQALLLP